MVNLYVNWFDLSIVVLLAVLIVRGIKDGFITQFLANVGFFGGLFFGGWLFPHLLPIHNPTLLIIINCNMVLTFAIVLGYGGFRLGRHLHYSFSKGWLGRLEPSVSVVFSLGTGLIAVWLIASMLGRLPFAGLSNSANDAYITQALDQRMPPIPAVLAVFDKQIDPNSLPQIFVRAHSQTQRLVPDTTPAIQAVAATAERSIVRITSFGCGGIVSGSGFIAAPHLVITNAHVIAGVHRPIVKYGTQSYVGTPVLFDPNLDLAVLRVSGLNAKPLVLAKGDINSVTTVAALGYPGGNYTVLPGVILDEQNNYSNNIYGIGTVNRLIYEVQVAISPGSSGGPIILLDGQVAGVIFAKSDTANGYALASSSLLSQLQQAQQSTRRVSTGVCV